MTGEPNESTDEGSQSDLTELFGDYTEPVLEVPHSGVQGLESPVHEFNKELSDVAADKTAGGEFILTPPESLATDPSTLNHIFSQPSIIPPPEHRDDKPQPEKTRLWGRKIAIGGGAVIVAAFGGLMVMRSGKEDSLVPIGSRPQASAAPAPETTFVPEPTSLLTTTVAAAEPLPTRPEVALPSSIVVKTPIEGKVIELPAIAGNPDEMLQKTLDLLSCYYSLGDNNCLGAIARRPDVFDYFYNERQRVDEILRLTEMQNLPNNPVTDKGVLFRWLGGYQIETTGTDPSNPDTITYTPNNPNSLIMCQGIILDWDFTKMAVIAETDTIGYIGVQEIIDADQLTLQKNGDGTYSVARFAHNGQEGNPRLYGSLPVKCTKAGVEEYLASK